MQHNPVEASLLYDLYGELLTPHQRDLWQLYYLEDWSLQEIGESRGISRSAVHDLLERTAKSLRDYEQKLGLIQALNRRRQLVHALQVQIETKVCQPCRAELDGILQQLVEEEGLGDV